MNPLAFQQERLLAALFDRPSDAAEGALAAYAGDHGYRGIRVYQANGHALAQRALAAAYPVIQQLVGEESFANLARALWHAEPPVCGDVGQWGSALVDFVAASDQLAQEPYLSEVARVEWALHSAATAANAGADPASLALLTTHDLSRVCLVLSPGVWTYRAAWPVVSIIHAHTEGAPSFDTVRQQLGAQLRQDLVVWRMGMRPCLREAVAGECLFVQRVLSGASLEASLEAAPDMDMSAWMPQALHSGLLLGVRAFVS